MIEINENDMPITVAEKLILATKEVNVCGFKMDVDIFSDDDLREIAGHLLVHTNNLGRIMSTNQEDRNGLQASDTD